MSKRALSFIIAASPFILAQIAYICFLYIVANCVPSQPVTRVPDVMSGMLQAYGSAGGGKKDQLFRTGGPFKEWVVLLFETTLKETVVAGDLEKWRFYGELVAAIDLK
jgi:hypothetical protein